jgi:hypothetical protein
VSVGGVIGIQLSGRRRSHFEPAPQYYPEGSIVLDLRRKAATSSWHSTLCQTGARSSTPHEEAADKARPQACRRRKTEQLDLLTAELDARAGLL